MSDGEGRSGGGSSRRRRGNRTGHGTHYPHRVPRQAEPCHEPCHRRGGAADDASAGAGSGGAGRRAAGGGCSAWRRLTTRAVPDLATAAPGVFWSRLRWLIARCPDLVQAGGCVADGHRRTAARLVQCPVGWLTGLAQAPPEAPWTVAVRAPAGQTLHRAPAAPPCRRPRRRCARRRPPAPPHHRLTPRPCPTARYTMWVNQRSWRKETTRRSAVRSVCG